MEYIDASMASGKTVKSIRESQNEELFFILFSDETYTAIYAEGYEYASIYNGDLSEYSIEARMEFGLITKEEYADIIERQNAERMARLEKIERIQYETLKKKFEQ